MQRPGRNDPCPCGSGKKYKRCCLGKETQRQEFGRDVAANALPLLRELGQYAARRAGQTPEKIAAERFPFWQPPLDNVKGARLLDFLIFDYHPDKYGTSAAQEFLTQRAPLLSQAWQIMLRAWSDVTTQLYVLESWSAGFASCRPALIPSAAVLDVMPLETAKRRIAAGQPIALRPLAVGTAYLYPSWPITFAARAVEDVLTAVQARHHSYVRRERIVAFDDFLKREPTVFDEEAVAGASTSRIILPGG